MYSSDTNSIWRPNKIRYVKLHSCSFTIYPESRSRGLVPRSPLHWISKETIKVVVFQMRREAPTCATPLMSLHKVCFDEFECEAAVHKSEPDFRNVILHGLPNYFIDKCKNVLNRAPVGVIWTRMCYGLRNYEQITCELQALYWLSSVVMDLNMR